jgi:outer membrane protein assembly factor BamB
MNPSTPSVGSAADSTGNSPTPVRGKISLANKLLLGWVGFLILAIAVARSPLIDDEALANLITMGACFALTMVAICFPMFQTSWSRPQRFGPAAAFAAICIGVGLKYKVRWNNAMVPLLSDRWEERPVALQADVKRDAAAPVVAEAARDPKFDFPQFLGSERRQVVRAVKLARDWKAKPPRELWRKPVGDGWSGFAVVGWRAVTLEQLGENETITCRDLKTGELVWTHSHPNVRYDQAPGGLGPRSTPTIHEGLVYTLGATGILDCLDLNSGDLRWSVDILGGDPKLIPEWGKACSPLIVGERVIVSAGAGPGKSLHAYDKTTGKLLWTGGDNFSSYASPELQTIEGVPQILIVNQDFLDAHDPETGEVLWSFSWPGASSSNANTAQAFALDQSRVFVSKHYGTGSAVFNVTRNEQGKWTASKDEAKQKQGWARNVLKNKINNVSVRDGFAYGIDDTILQCVDLETGKQRWKGGRYGAGQILLVDDLLLVQGEKGDLLLVEAKPEKYVEVAKLPDVLHEEPCWNPPALAAPYLVIRNWKEAVCLELPLAEGGE